MRLSQSCQGQPVQSSEDEEGTQQQWVHRIPANSSIFAHTRRLAICALILAWHEQHGVRIYKTTLPAWFKVSCPALQGINFRLVFGLLQTVHSILAQQVSDWGNENPMKNQHFELQCFFTSSQFFFGNVLLREVLQPEKTLPKACVRVDLVWAFQPAQPAVSSMNTQKRASSCHLTWAFFSHATSVFFFLLPFSWQAVLDIFGQMIDHDINT